METIIKEVENKIYPDGNEFLIVRFDFAGKLRFTYLSKKSLDYWASKGITLDKFIVGAKIIVKEVPNEDKKQYRIMSFI